MLLLIVVAAVCLWLGYIVGHARGERTGRNLEARERDHPDTPHRLG